MKKLYSLFAALFAVVFGSAQLVITQPSAGVLTLTYGANNDYSLYDPGFGTTTFYIHSWITASQNSANTMFEDSWDNSNITMTYDATLKAYVGTINLNNKLFTRSNNVIPAGTTVSNIGLVFKDQQVGATKQSADISAANYGFTGTTTVGTLGVSNVNAFGKSFVANGKLYSAKKGSLEIHIIDFSGRTVKAFKTLAGPEAIDLGFTAKGMFLVKISDGVYSEVVKFKN